jgi:transposase, IS5 family
VIQRGAVLAGQRKPRHTSHRGAGFPPLPTDASLSTGRERLVRFAKKLGVSLRQSYRRVGELALLKQQRYAHAHQFKRANRSLRKLKTYLGRPFRKNRFSGWSLRKLNTVASSPARQLPR